MSNGHGQRPFLAHTIRRLAVPIILVWVGLAALTNSTVPQLEEVGKAHNVALGAKDASSLQAMKRMG